MRTDHILGLDSQGFHRLHYTEWGDPDNPQVVVCVHGLTRNSRDFDYLARGLLHAYRVICPDMPGRGLSQWLPNPADYSYPQYLNDLTALIARTGAHQVDWVGTSMGGLLGMILAARSNSPIRRLVMNDIGPFVGVPALERIGQYIMQRPQHASLPDFERYLRSIICTFGPLDDEHWHHLAEHGVRRTAQGQLEWHFDPQVAATFVAACTQDIDLWAFWEALPAPPLVLRGAHSDVLPLDVATEMTQRGPGAILQQYAETGHAPALMLPEQVAEVRNWLLDDQ